MEDTLEVYERPYDPMRPQVCLDETSKELHGQTRTPIAAEPPRSGHAATPAREDYEYKRNGTSNVFMLFEPLAGRRCALVSERRTALDYANSLKHLVDVLYPSAEKIVLVQDNLNTHHPASLYEAFAPEEARRIAEKIEWHYTPKHGSWLNMAEIELRILSNQCLSRRIGDRETLVGQVAAWEKRRNDAGGKVDWQFRNKDARIKLKRLYPKIQP